MNSVKKYFFLAFISVLIFSCRKDSPPTISQQEVSLSTSKRLLICDEGNFGQSNAAFTVYDPISNDVSINAFLGSNPNESLGDVLQSVTKFNNTYYLVVNNSGKIVVCNTSFNRLATVSGFTSPRYMQVVSNSKAYVSNLQLNNSLPNYIQVMDINTNTITKNIRLDGWSEQMVESYGYVFVCNQSKHYVYVITTATDVITDSIYVGATSASIVKDTDENLWVSCNADATNSISAKLVKINPVTRQTTNYLLNTTQNSIARLSINGTGTTLYYLMSDVYKMNISDTLTPTSSMIQRGSKNFYGLCIDPDDETIYISDASDYNSNGKLYRYQANATFVNTFTTSISPGFMWMDKQ